MARRKKQNEKPHFSPSQLEMYSRCPQQWAFRYLENLIIPPGVAAIRGKGIHGGAAVNNRQKIKSRRDLPVKEVVEAAASEFELGLASGYSLTPEEESIGATLVLGRAKDETVAAAGFWVENIAPVYQPKLVEQYFRIELSGSRDLVGYIDCADEHTTIVDLKTSSKRKTQADADGSIQLTSYAAGHHALTGKSSRDQRLETVVITSAGSIYRDLKQTTRSTADFQALASRINVTAAAIQTGIFPPAAIGWWGCSPRWCGYWNICPYVNSEQKGQS